MTPNYEKRNTVSELEEALDAAHEFAIGAVQYGHFPGEVDEQELVKRIDRVARRIDPYFVTTGGDDRTPGEAALHAAERKVRSLQHQRRSLVEAGEDVDAEWLEKTEWLEEAGQTVTVHAMALAEVIKWRLAELIYQRAILPNPLHIRWLAGAIAEGGEVEAIVKANPEMFD
jgi:hypothetical protein